MRQEPRSLSDRSVLFTGSVLWVKNPTVFQTGQFCSLALYYESRTPQSFRQVSLVHWLCIMSQEPCSLSDRSVQFTGSVLWVKNPAVFQTGQFSSLALYYESRTPQSFRQVSSVHWLCTMSQEPRSLSDMSVQFTGSVLWVKNPTVWDRSFQFLQSYTCSLTAVNCEIFDLLLFYLILKLS